MKRLKLYILVFCLALSAPLSFVIWRTYAGLAQEEWAQLRFFSETLFDDMEKELSDLVLREEARAVDEYNHVVASANRRADASPLAAVPREDYILGYLQNNPDGTMQTPLVADLNRIPQQYRPMVDQLKQINGIFNQKKYALPVTAEPPGAEMVLAEEVQSEKESNGFADRYIAKSKRKSEKISLGQQSVRIEEISPRQAANLARDEVADLDAQRESRSDYEPSAAEDKDSAGGLPRLLRPRQQVAASASGPVMQARPAAHPQRFQVEVAPLQSVFVDPQTLFIFRRVAIDNQVFRQGFVLKIQPFLRHLAQTHFERQPMAGFARLRLMVMDQGGQREVVGAGAAADARRLVAARTFPAPFNFIGAEVLGDRLPTSLTRRALHMALIALGAVILIGLFSIYHSVRAVVELSERRSQFVSSVTHELKTPLTNIRMYVEMLEQGIAATPEREQEYLGVIGSESSRLSRLINNVLELSKLEKKQRMVHLAPGRLEDVLAEVRAVMAPKLAQEDFELHIQADQAPRFMYDREAMIQVLINLIENSIKFGRNAPERRICVSVETIDGWVRIAVADTGPGIPQHALSKVFDDFYRADNALTRTTGGTGIGLALVKKLIQAMGGRVKAVNNDGPGCTMSLVLPYRQGDSEKMAVES